MAQTLEDLDRIVARLAGQRDAAIQFTAYLRDISESEGRWEKYRNSLAGNVINLNIVSAENSLILICCRLWDKGGDTQSLPCALNLLGKLGDQIRKRRSADIDAEFTENWPEKQRVLLGKIISVGEELAKSPVRPAIRVMRTENLAHLIEISRDRESHFPDGFDDHGVTRNMLFDFAEESARLIDDIRLLTIGTSADFDSSAAVFKRYCERYWNALPTFREVE